jgi:hypothetical protein
MELDQELDEVGGGVEHGTSTGEATTAPTTPNRQPKVNLNEIEEFKKWQSAADRRVEDAARRAYEAEQRAAALEQSFHQNAMSQLEGAERVAYENNLLRKNLENIQRQRDLDAYAIQRQRDLQEIASKTGAPLEAIEDAPNVHVAWARAYEYAAQNNKPKPREEEIAERANDNVDIGGGRPRGKASALQEEYNKHRKAYDLGKQLEVMARADREGVAIDEW